MDIKSLKYFLAVAEEKSVTRAAERLFIAQPPLSRQMHLLEQELGVTLFIRGKRQIRLTEEGYYLKHQAEEMLYLLEKTTKHLDVMNHSEFGTVSVGSPESCCLSVLPQIIGEFHKICPNINFQIWSGDSDEVQERLERNLIDIAIVREPIKIEKCDKIFLKSEPWIVIFNKMHPLANLPGKFADITQLDGQSLIVPSRQSLQNEINGWFVGNQISNSIICTYNLIGSVITLAQNGLGVIVCPESNKNLINSNLLSYKKISPPAHDSKIYLVKKHLQAPGRHLQKFWDLASTFSEEA